MVAFPAATAVTNPALTVATPAAELVHLAELVTSLVVPFTVVPLAVNCFVLPTVKKIEIGVMLMVFRELPETKKSPQPVVTNVKTRIRRRTVPAPDFVLTAVSIRIIREFYQMRLL